MFIKESIVGRRYPAVMVLPGRRDVLRLVGGAGAALVAGGCSLETSDEESVGSIEQMANTAAGVNLTYLAAFDRPATQAEISYWVGTGHSDGTILKYHRQWMRTTQGAGDRVRVIINSFQKVFGRIYGSAEFSYWNNYLLNNDALFCDVCKWHEAYGRNGGYPHTGWYRIKHVYDSVTQNGPSIEDYSGKMYNVPAS